MITACVRHNKKKGLKNGGKKLSAYDTLIILEQVVSRIRHTPLLLVSFGGFFLSGIFFKGEFNHQCSFFMEDHIKPRTTPEQGRGLRASFGTRLWSS